MQTVARDFYADTRFNHETIVKNAVQFYAAHSSFARFHCAVARKILNQMPEGEYIIDTRTHMLKPGWLPCIGGWHFDDVTRGPNMELLYEETDPSMEHYLYILDAGSGSLTEFVTIPFVPASLRLLGVHDYAGLNGLVEDLREGYEKHGYVHKVPNDTLIKFNVFEAHRGIQATGHGWRYFFRATKLDATKRKVFNEIRTQTQVYIPESHWEKGW